MRTTGRTRTHPHDDAPDTAAAFERLARLPDGPERKALRDELVRVWLPMAERIAVRFRGRGEALEDLYQVAALGLVANVIAFLLLRRGADESLNVRGAYLEVLADLVGSIGVLVSGALTLTTGWRYADPIIGVAIGVFVLPRTVVLARRALRILFQHAPHGIDVEALDGDLRGLPGVADVHDLHVWTLTSGMEVASAHLTIDVGAKSSEVLASAQQVLSTRYAIEHATLQVEPKESARRCEQLRW